MFRPLLLLLGLGFAAPARGDDFAERLSNLQRLADLWIDSPTSPAPEALDAALHEAQLLDAPAPRSRLLLVRARIDGADDRTPDALRHLAEALGQADRASRDDAERWPTLGAETRLLGSDLLASIDLPEGALALAGDAAEAAIAVGWVAGAAQATRAALLSALRVEQQGSPGAFALAVVAMDGRLGALESYRTAPAGRPGAMGLLIADLGEDLLRQGDPAAAASAFALALRTDGLDGRIDHKEDWARLGWAATQSGQAGAARWALVQLGTWEGAALPPWTADLALRTSVHGLAAEGRFADALTALPPDDPERPPWQRSLRADLLALLGQTVPAATLHAELADRLPIELARDERVEGGIAWLRTGRTPDAKRVLEPLADTPLEALGPDAWLRLCWARAWIAAQAGDAEAARAALAQAGELLLGLARSDDLAALAVEYAHVAAVAGSADGERDAVLHAARFEDELGLGGTGYRARLALGAWLSRAADPGALAVWKEGVERCLLWRASRGAEARSAGRPPLWPAAEDEGAVALFAEAVRRRRPAEAVMVRLALDAAAMWAEFPDDDAARARHLGPLTDLLDDVRQSREHSLRAHLRGHDGASPPTPQDGLPALRAAARAARGDPSRRLLALTDLSIAPRLPKGPVRAAGFTFPTAAGPQGVVVTSGRSRFVPAPTLCETLLRAAGTGRAVQVGDGAPCPGPVDSFPNLALLMALLAEGGDQAPPIPASPTPTLAPLDALALGEEHDDGVIDALEVLRGVAPPAELAATLPAWLTGAPPPWAPL